MGIVFSHYRFYLHFSGKWFDNNLREPILKRTISKEKLTASLPTLWEHLTEKLNFNPAKLISAQPMVADTSQADASQSSSSFYSLIHKAIIFTIQLLPLSITIGICYRLAQLFHLYEEGSLFELDNIKIIKQISIFMITGELIQIIYQPLITAALSFNNPAGQRFASITLGSTNLTTLITAFIILIASWIVKEAHELKNDAQLTI